MRCQLALFSAYRIDQYGDPEGFKASLGAVLEQYPDDVIRYVCDPRTGVQRQCKFPPTISEIVTACDARIAEQRRTQRLMNWGNNNAPMLEPPRENRPTYEQLKAKYGDNWGIEQDRRVKTEEQKAEANRAALEREQARVRAEYEHIGQVPPSKLALSPTALHLVAQQDELRDAS